MTGKRLARAEMSEACPRQDIDGLIVVQRGHVVHADIAACSILGCAPQLAGVSWETFASTHVPGFASSVPQAYAAIVAGEPWRGRVEIESKRPGGASHIEFTFSSLLWKGQPGLSCAVRDISRWRRAVDALEEWERRRQQLLESMTEGVVLLDGGMAVTHVNTPVVELGLARSAEEATGRSLLSLFPASDRDRASREMQAAQKTGRGAWETKVKRWDGSESWCRLRATVLREKGDAFIGFAIGIQDIERERRMEAAARSADRQLASLGIIAHAVQESGEIASQLERISAAVLEALESAVVGIYLIDEPNGTLVLAASAGASQSFLRATGAFALEEAALLESAASSTGVTTIAHVDKDKSLGLLGRLAERADGIRSVACAPLASRGHCLGLILIADVVVREFSPEQKRFLEIAAGLIASCVENGRLLERMNRLSLIDEVTGLPARTQFLESLGKEVHRSRRYGGSFALAILRLGAQQGDTKGRPAVDPDDLRTLARAFKADLRKSDVLGRFDHDQLAILFPSTSADKADLVIRRVAGAWRESLKGKKRGNARHVELSSAVAQFPEDGDTVDGLTSRIEKLLLEEPRAH